MGMWYREAGGMYRNGKTKMFGRNIYIDPFDTEAIKKQFNNIDVYTTPYIYNKKPQKESILYSGFYIDLDLKVSKQDDYIKVRNDALTVVSIFMNDFKIPERFIDIYYSGSKGFHIIINPVVLGIKPSKTLNEDFKLLARRIKSYTLHKTIDTVIYDNVRLIRLPNTINSKSGLYKVRITKKMLETFTYNQMKYYASKPRPDNGCKTVKPIQYAHKKYLELIKAQRDEDEVKVNTGNKKHIGKKKQLDGLLPCIAYILETGAEDGNRNNTTVALASSLFQCGGTLEDVTNTILEWNDNKNEKRISDHEIRATILSAYRQYKEDRVYGCGKLRELGYCLGTLCKLYNRGVR